MGGVWLDVAADSVTDDRVRCTTAGLFDPTDIVLTGADGLGEEPGAAQ